MAKRKKASKVQKRTGATARRKARKPSKAARGKATTVARAKFKRAPVTKAGRRSKQPVTPAVETVAVEHATPEFEEVNKVSPGPDEAAE